MKRRELKQLSKQDLSLKLEDLKKELLKYNAQVSTKTQPENPGRIKVIKKTIAKMNTLLYSKNQKEAKKKQ